MTRKVKAVEEQEIISLAMQSRQHARAPYSGFLVGAALETAGGEVFTGCNFENATIGLAVCAERVALWKAMSEGHADFKRMAMVADTVRLTPPCGACRQLIWEFCGDIELVLANLRGDSEIVRMRDIFPRAFDAPYIAEVGAE